ncbi:TATA box-binding protein-associated factor RNA polymerase I subunit B-like [Tubulanus polymorphus]|uniref:TATA box-binding protein-associated factor RNA polymerase I subunit B-like n=1 Tax=Tubulanus polymorphus TaxID=672921 RepID=UPI003DA4EB51
MEKSSSAKNACILCGANDFECFDGFFYCVQCQTQSQDYRHEEFDIEDINWQGRVRANRRIKKCKMKVNIGRPWTTIEVFQIILKEQVKALIKLGADKSLDDVVWRLWRRYLSKSKIAFSPEIEETPETDYPRIRDILKWRSEEKVPDIRRLATMSCKETKANTEKIKDVNIPGLPRLEEGMANNSEDDIFRVDDEEDDDNEDKEEMEGHLDINQDDLQKILKVKRDQTKFVEVKTERGSRKLGLVRNARNEIRDNIKRMNMIKTLAFCKLGLIYTNNLVMMADIIRWTREHLLPFLNVSTILPEDIVVRGLDSSTFFSQQEVPPIENLCETTGKLVEFLDIDKVPAVEISKIIGKYGIEMALPSDIIGMAQNFLLILQPNDSYEPHPTGSPRYQPYPLYEAQAIAYIIITLKLLFGVNDHSERELSNYGRNLQNLLSDNTKHRLFIWDEWALFMEKRLRNFQSQVCPHSIESLKDGIDVKACMRHYCKLATCKGRAASVPEELKCKGPMRYRTDVQESLVETFQTLLQFVYSNSEHVPDASSDSEFFDKFVPITSKADGSSLHFSSMSIQYLIDKDFINCLGKDDICNVFWEEVPGECDGAKKSFESDDSDADQLDEISSPLRMAEVFGKSRKRKRVLDLITKNIKKKKTAALTTEQMKIVEDLQFSVCRAYQNYSVYTLESNEPSWHLSYDWLLNICSYITETPKTRIHKEVAKLELVHILDKGSLTENKHSLRGKIMKTFH